MAETNGCLIDLCQHNIASARLQPGARMPSTRMLAEQFAISRITVLLTYERLIAEDWKVNEKLKLRGEYTFSYGSVMFAQ